MRGALLLGCVMPALGGLGRWEKVRGSDTKDHESRPRGHRYYPCHGMEYAPARREFTAAGFARPGLAMLSSRA